MDCAPAMRQVVEEGLFDKPDFLELPVGLFYDMDLWDKHLREINTAFGQTFLHCAAMKSCPVTKMLRHLHEQHGMGAECASVGEALHAMGCGIPVSHVVFDSPCKTRRELEWCLEQRLPCNFDNLEEYARAKAFLASHPELATGDVALGCRINPLVGAGAIAALSVSTAASKFGTPITEKPQLLEIYQASPWLTSVHVHVGSGGMGAEVLTAGIRVAVDFAKEVNSAQGRRQVTQIDIGGGLPANYGGDEWAADKVPTMAEYAAHLRREVPELFSGEFRVITEFGQSMFAKCGFFASRVEWLKGPEENLAIVHFGADCCPRQVYTIEHKRRVEAYKADGSSFGSEAETKAFSIGGPLCFQGDFVAKDVQLPAALRPNDIIVMKDSGSSTLSMFSRHCSRTCPPVYGIRLAGGKVQIETLKGRETMQQLSAFWGDTDAGDGKS